jgi:hypothetical protein
MSHLSYMSSLSDSERAGLRVAGRRRVTGVEHCVPGEVRPPPAYEPQDALGQVESGSETDEEGAKKYSTWNSIGLEMKDGQRESTEKGEIQQA